MKDLNKILERQDYVRMTSSLRKKCNQVVEVISEKMKELDLEGTDKGMFVNGMRIFCAEDTIYIRALEEEQESGIAVYSPVSTQMNYKNFYVEGTGNFEFFPCSNKNALRFLNNAVAIIEKLGEIEEKKVNAINRALEITENV